jgi:hypothetical protein
MIPFTMNILHYNTGAYRVEYVPNNNKCKPIKMSVRIDESILSNKDAVLDALKASSPQIDWIDQIRTAESVAYNSVAEELVNTTYQIYSVPPVAVTPVNGVPSSVDTSQPTTLAHIPQTVGTSTPERIAPAEDQNVIKMKILIQQVLQEMAEGTV